MNIRSITYFCDPDVPLDPACVAAAGDFIRYARKAFTSAGYTVQTVRLALPPFPRLLPEQTPAAALDYAGQFEAAAREQGFEYLSLGPAIPSFPDSYAFIPEIIANSEIVFCTGNLTSAAGEISLPAVRACARVIHALAPLEPDGFANLRFAALANVPGGGPFFPAAYHSGGPPSFALALESADLAVEAFSHTANLSAARAALVEAIEAQARALTQLAQKLTADFDIDFNGLDFSMAPFPEQARSLGAALERLGVQAVGLPGALAGAAVIAYTIDSARYPRAGFNGLMLPVLEDATLARRAAEGTLSVKDLLLYSAVCGTGLDTVPLPGDTDIDTLAALLLDIAALATRLDKPLTARLMPAPGKAAGDPTSFDFAYFANSRVLALPAARLSGHLAGSGLVRLEPRRRDTHGQI